MTRRRFLTKLISPWRRPLLEAPRQEKQQNAVTRRQALVAIGVYAALLFTTGCSGVVLPQNKAFDPRLNVAPNDKSSEAELEREKQIEFYEDKPYTVALRAAEENGKQLYKNGELLFEGYNFPIRTNLGTRRVLFGCFHGDYTLKEIAEGKAQLASILGRDYVPSYDNDEEAEVSERVKEEEVITATLLEARAFSKKMRGAQRSRTVRDIKKIAPTLFISKKNIEELGGEKTILDAAQLAIDIIKENFWKDCANGFPVLGAPGRAVMPSVGKRSPK